MMTCKDCKWSHSAGLRNDGSIFYECRKNPPVAVVFDDEIVSIFPEVDDKACCGDFEPIASSGFKQNVVEK